MFSDLAIAPPKSPSACRLDLVRDGVSIATWNYNIRVDMVTYRYHVDRDGRPLQLSYENHQQTLRHYQGAPGIFEAESASILYRSQEVRLGGWFTDGEPHASIVVFPVITGNHVGLLCVGETHFKVYDATIYSFEGDGLSEYTWHNRGDDLLTNPPTADRVAYWDEHIVGMALYVDSHIKVTTMIQRCRFAANNGWFVRCTDLLAYFLDHMNNDAHRWRIPDCKETWNEKDFAREVLESQRSH